MISGKEIIKNNRGYTLIEMIIVIAVGSILMAGLVSAAQIQFKSTVENRNYLVALNLAMRQMAIANSADYPALSIETAQTADSSFPNFIPTQEVTLIDTSGIHSLELICVRVRLGSLSGPVLVALNTYRSDILTLGDGV
jgi:prepilin-type N-terminal cleavage/methylation domain-containing protein